MQWLKKFEDFTFLSFLNILKYLIFITFNRQASEMVPVSKQDCFCVLTQIPHGFLPLSPPGWRGFVRAAGRAAARFAEPISL